jgi:hypothetical protein
LKPEAAAAAVLGDVRLIVEELAQVERLWCCNPSLAVRMKAV